MVVHYFLNLGESIKYNNTKAKINFLTFFLRPTIFKKVLAKMYQAYLFLLVYSTNANTVIFRFFLDLPYVKTTLALTNFIKPSESSDMG